MAVDDGEYRVQDLAVTMGEGARTGRLRIVTPFGAPVAPGDAPVEDRSVLRAVETELHAVLARTRVPYGWLAGLRPGAVLEVPVEALAAVRLEDADGRLVAHARLGQSQGMRALRLLDEPPDPIPDPVPVPVGRGTRPAPEAALGAAPETEVLAVEDQSAPADGPAPEASAPE